MTRAISLMAALLLLVAPSPALAAYDPVGSGVTHLVLDKRFSEFLSRTGVGISTAAGATKRGGVLVFPVSGGFADPTVGAGEIEQQGSFSLSGPRGRVRIRKLVVKTAHAPIVAKVGGSQLKIATTASITSTREGFGIGFTAKKLQLTEKVATRLNKKLRPRQPFSAGQLIGGLVTEAQPVVTAIDPVGRVTLIFDSAFVAKLDQRFVSLNPIFPAEHQGPIFTLPIIADGALAPDASQGILRTGGDIEFLQLGAGQVFWHELWFDLGSASTLAEVDLEPFPSFSGRLGQVRILALDGGETSLKPAAREIGLGGVRLALATETAAAFNKAFADGAPVFSPGETVGMLSFVAQAQ